MASKISIKRRLKNNILILDGATGTELQKCGMPAGASPELWCLENPETVIHVQSAYRDSGCDIIYTPTFGANRFKLAEYGADNVKEINRGLAETFQVGGGKAMPRRGRYRADGQVCRAIRRPRFRGCRQRVQGAGPGASRRRRGPVCHRDHDGHPGGAGGPYRRQGSLRALHDRHHDLRTGREDPERHRPGVGADHPPEPRGRCRGLQLLLRPGGDAVPHQAHAAVCQRSRSSPSPMRAFPGLSGQDRIRHGPGTIRLLRESRSRLKASAL